MFWVLYCRRYLSCFGKKKPKQTNGECLIITTIWPASARVLQKCLLNLNKSWSNWTGICRSSLQSWLVTKAAIFMTIPSRSESQKQSRASFENAPKPHTWLLRHQRAWSGGWNNRVNASMRWLMAVKVPTVTYKSLSPAVFICCQYMYAFIRRAAAVKAPRRKRHFQWLISVPAPRWSPPQTSSSPCVFSPVTFSFSSAFQAEGSSVELSACNFTPRGEKKKAPSEPLPHPVINKTVCNF